MKSDSCIIKGMKIIHCSVWGDIEISDLAIQIIDTQHFQRLHYIKQTGFAYKVFPTATSSRFEHSVGVYNVTRRIFDKIKKKQPEVCPDDRTIELVSIVGLVHDLGHGPFSHLYDTFLKNAVGDVDWCSHEYRSIILFRDLVQEYDIPLSTDEIDFICLRISHPPQEYWYDTLVCNPFSSIDTDKMDYVIRDSFHFGLTCYPNMSRLWNNMMVIDEKLCFCERVRDEIQLFFQIRERMHRTMYRHPKIEYFQDHFLNILYQHYTTDAITTDVKRFICLNDMSVLNMFHPSIWVPVETRKAPKVQSTFSSQGFYDNQWQLATENIRYYSRKTPTVSFVIHPV